MPQPFFARRHTGSASRTTVAAGAFVEYYDRTMAKPFKRVYWWGKTAWARVPPPKPTLPSAAATPLHLIWVWPDDGPALDSDNPR